jgi:hypothetical protein
MERGSTTPRVLAAGQYTEVLEFDYLDCALPAPRKHPRATTGDRAEF